jgi:putative ABC transport system permease protein
MELVMAIRNLIRHWKRNLLVSGTIVVGILSIIIIGGYYEYNYWGLRESMIRSQFGHIQIYPKGFLENRDVNQFGYKIDNFDEVMKFSKSLPDVVVVTPRLEYMALMNTPDGRSKIVNVRGVIPEEEGLIVTFVTHKEGISLRSKDKDSVEVGYTLSKEMDLKLGSQFFLTVVKVDGEQNAMAFNVKSIVGSYSEEFDRRIVRMNLKTAQELIGFPYVQEIVVLLNDTDKTGEIKRMIEKEISSRGWRLEVTDWLYHAGYYVQVVEFYGGYFRIILSIIVIVVFFVSLITSLMSFFERITEVGTIRSFGANNGTIFKMFFYEGFVMGVFSTVMGVLLGLGVASIINLLGGIYMPPPPGLTTSVMVKIIVKPNLILISSVVGVLIPIISALIIFFKTIRMTVVEQIKVNEQ